MFRVVSEFLQPNGQRIEQPPFYMLICDDPRCATMFQFPVPTTDMAINPEIPALNAARQEGWLITIGRQLCPGHKKQLEEIMDAGMHAPKRIVVPANNVHPFGRKQ